ALGLTAPAEAGAAAGRKSAWRPWSIAALAAAAALVFALRGPAPKPDAPDLTRRLRIDVPGATGFGTLRAAPPVISPDGRNVVFGVAGDNGEINLWVRSLDDFNMRPLPNTRNAAFLFWSPDSRHVGYFDTVKLKRIEVSTGRIQTIGGQSSAFPRGGSWNAAGQVLYVPDSNSGVHLIEAAGGEGRQITTPDPNVPDYSHRWPSFLPDGKHFLFTAWTNDLRARPEHAGIFLASIAGDADPVRIIPDASSVVYAPPGYILFVRDGNLIVVPFDPEELRVTGEAQVIASGLLYNQGTAYGVFSASHEGTLVYARGTASLPANLTWYGRDGSSTAAAGEPAPFADLRLSPSADRAAVTIPGESGDEEIWILDLERGVRTRLQSAPWSCTNPIWSGAGDRVLFASQQSGFIDFEAMLADGVGEPVSIFADDSDKQPYDWSRDGRYIAYWPQGASASGTADIWIYSAETKTVTPLITGDSTFQDARFSPDGRFIAYVSDDSSRLEVYVQQLVIDDGVKGGARRQLSISGGTGPHWRDDGREIVYLDPKQQVTAVSVEPQGDRLNLGTPRVLFRIDGRIVSFDAAGDHQRFLVATQDGPDSEPLHVVLNWTADLE
ncbi:MAG TPA: DPP IV N-terminal domain-containing protein, partial [Candidatus Polarisedimenticolia bacterium]|nr:DPP IV N-terminal domain-containing protein [Candidatus Polarisedimenticolia bacterium]